MSKKKGPARSQDRSKLSERVMQVSSSESRPGQEVDSLDTDLSGYLSALISDMAKTPKLENISLATQEDALEAIKVLDTTKDVLDSNLRKARALRQLLEQKRGD